VKGTNKRHLEVTQMGPVAYRGGRWGRLAPGGSSKGGQHFQRRAAKGHTI